MLSNYSYDPDHPADPNPPTFRNRFACAVLGHHDHFDFFDSHNKIIHLICLRCSRTIQRVYAPARLGSDTDVSQW